MSTGPVFPALPKEDCSALIVAKDTVPSRTRETLPRRAMSPKSAQNKLSALSRVVKISCVEGDSENSLSQDIPMGSAIATWNC